jgi:hypothetical protein
MTLRPLVVALVLGLALFFAATTDRTPAPVPASAPPTEFSAERAMVHVAALAVRPHPTGTAAADAARAYLVQYLGSLGIPVDVHDTTFLTEEYARRWDAPVVAARVRNVVALRKGTEPGPALLLMAHYDSRELAPGASDDGYGCATLLETARALAASAPLRHDVLLLLTEGEEQGLLGARAFLAEDPRARDVALVLNFDARGDRGPVALFQTSPGAGALMDVVAGAVAPITAISPSQEVYRRMPNDTDLTPWLEAGAPGLNFANIDGFEHYHQPTDTAANASLETLQHFGAYALALARAFGDRGEIVPPAGGDAVYFRAGPVFVHYAAKKAPMFACFAAGLFALAIGFGIGRKRVRIGAVLAGAGLGALGLVAAAALAWALGRLADWLGGGALDMQTARDVVRKAAIAGFLFVGVAVSSAVTVLALRRRRAAELAMGPMASSAALAVASALAFPGASYLFTWPLVAAAAAWCVHMATPSLPDRSWVLVGLHLVAPVVALLLLLPAALQLGIAFGPASGPGLAAVAAIGATTAIPLLAFAEPDRRWILPALPAAAAVGCLAVACALPPFDTASPRPDSLLYAIDADHNASWLSFDASPDAWTAHVLAGARRASLGKLFPRWHASSWQAPAPTVAALVADSPHVDVLADTSDGDQRTLRLRVTLPAATEVVSFEAPPEAHVVASRVQGRTFGVEPRDGWVDLAFFGPPPEGLELELVAATHGRVTLSAVVQTRGLPAELEPRLGPRPPDRMPEVARRIRLPASDVTLVAASFDL